MDTSKVFKLQGELNAKGVAEGLEKFFDLEKGMYSEILPIENGFIIQAKEREAKSWKKFVGVSKATKIKLEIITEEIITVEIGSGEWTDKGVAAAAGAIVFAPLLVTAGVGAYQQKNLVAETFEFIDEYVKSDGQRGLRSVVQPTVVVQQAAAAPIEKSPVERVKELKELLDMEIITQEEFDTKKKEILGL